MFFKCRQFVQCRLKITTYFLRTKTAGSLHTCVHLFSLLRFLAIYISGWLFLPHRSPFIDIAMTCSTSQRNKDFSRPLFSSVYQEEMLKRQLTFSVSAASSFSPRFSVLSFCSHFLLVPSFPPDPYLFILPLIFSSSVFYVSSPTGSMQRCLPGNLFHAFDYEKIKYKKLTNH